MGGPYAVGWSVGRSEGSTSGASSTSVVSHQSSVVRAQSEPNWENDPQATTSTAWRQKASSRGGEQRRQVVVGRGRGG